MHRPKYHDTFVLLIFPHFSKYVFIMKYYTLQILIFFGMVSQSDVFKHTRIRQQACADS